MRFGATSLRLAVLLPLALLPAQTIAQQKTGQDSPAIVSEKRSGNDFHASFAASEFAFNGKVIVRDTPFSAIAVTETLQTLSDGRHVKRQRQARVYRDGAGSVRIESVAAEGKAGSFMLYDAVSGATYMVSSKLRTALQFSPPVADASLRRAEIITPQSPPQDLRNVVGETIEPLGIRVIEGVKVEGVRITSRVPTNAGTATSGMVVFERWYSHELRRNVMIKITDPRFGEAVYRLTDVQRTEPPHDLFVLPAGYKINPIFPARDRVSDTN